MLFLAVGLCPPAGLAATEDAVTLDPSITYQTFTDWEATAQAGQEFPAFARYGDSLFDQAVNDLGLNRLRLEIHSNAENRVDYWTEHRAGRIDDATWSAHLATAVNDNDDPRVIDPAGFQFASLDHNVETVVLPVQRRLEARGEKLRVNLCYVSFLRKPSPDAPYPHESPEEYAEFVLATCLHLRAKYGWAPDLWETILEPDNTYFWRGPQIGRAIVAAGRRLRANGFATRFIAPSTTDMGRAPVYADGLLEIPEALPFVAELAYHRYGGVSAKNLLAIAERAARNKLGASMLEHIGSGYQDLHQDLKLGRNTAWQQYTLAFPGVKDDGAQYYVIDESDPAAPRAVPGVRTPFLRQYFRYIRRGAVRIEAAATDVWLDPLAFVNADGTRVVVVKTDAGGAFAVRGLPAGRYGITFTTAARSGVDAEDVTISEGQSVAAAIPAAGVATIYGKPAQPRR